MVNFPQVTVSTDLRDGLCFGCGQNNPIGLKLEFRRDGNGVAAEFIPGKLHQGWPGILHGGIITCLLDEAMSYAAYFTGRSCLTAKMEIEIKRPAPLDQPLVITAAVTRHTRRLIETEARVCLRDGTLIALSRAKQFVVKTNSTGESKTDAIR